MTVSRKRANLDANAHLDGSGELRREINTKYARTRARILDAAAFVLRRQGYSGTRLLDVAQRAGIQTPAIYYYFACRDDLIVEVMANGLAELREHLESVLAALPKETSPLDRILAAAEAHLRHGLEASDYTMASIRTRGQVPPRPHDTAAEERDKYGALWRQLFDEATRAGQLRSDVDPQIAQMLVLGALNWTTEWWDLARTSLDPLLNAAHAFISAALNGDACDGNGQRGEI